jgi:hypothetical protein
MARLKPCPSVEICRSLLKALPFKRADFFRSLLKSGAGTALAVLQSAENDPILNSNKDRFKSRESADCRI